MKNQEEIKQVREELIKEVLESELEGIENSFVFDTRPYEVVLLEVSKIEGFKQFLKAILANDIKRNFFAEQSQHQSIRGGFSRTKWMYDMLVKISKKNILDNE
jgi:hypothetical protein